MRRGIRVRVRVWRRENGEVLREGFWRERGGVRVERENLSVCVCV